VILLEQPRRRERCDRLRSAQQIGKDDGAVKLGLLNRAEDTGEYFVRMGTARRAIAATHFAGDDSGAQGLFRAPVGGVDRRVEQKHEDRWVFDREMRGEALGDAATARLIDESIEPILKDLWSERGWWWQRQWRSRWERERERRRRGRRHRLWR
jgi:hypothetical protein